MQKSLSIKAHKLSSSSEEGISLHYDKISEPCQIGRLKVTKIDYILMYKALLLIAQKKNLPLCTYTANLIVSFAGTLHYCYFITIPRPLLPQFLQLKTDEEIMTRSTYITCKVSYEKVRHWSLGETSYTNKEQLEAQVRNYIGDGKHKVFFPPGVSKLVNFTVKNISESGPLTKLATIGIYSRLQRECLKSHISFKINKNTIIGPKGYSCLETESKCSDGYYNISRYYAAITDDLDYIECFGTVKYTKGKWHLARRDDYLKYGSSVTMSPNLYHTEKSTFGKLIKHREIYNDDLCEVQLCPDEEYNIDGVTISIV
jgi:hypothetical protein